jgi:uncharacterized protein (TIGR02271 family)
VHLYALLARRAALVEHYIREDPMAESSRNLVRLRDSGFNVAEGEADPRGWKVFSSDGRKVGEVEELIGDTSTRRVRFLDLDLDEKELGLEGDRHALIPVGYARLDEDERKVMLEGLSSAEIVRMPATVTDITPEHERRFEAAWPEREVRVTRSEEELEIDKREVERGDLDISKHVETEHVTRPVSRTHDEVEIVRRPAERMRAGEAEFREETHHIPLHEEEIEVRKRPEVREELIVRTHPVTEEEDIEADLRKERIDIEEHGRVDKFDRGERKGRFGRERGR